MSEKRKKSGTLLLKFRGKTTKIELFPASQWEEGSALPHALRLRVDGKWQESPDGPGPLFLGPDALAEYLKRSIYGTNPTPPRPPIYPGTPISVLNGRTMNGTPMRDRTRARDYPTLGTDGRWYVLAACMACAPRLFPCDEVVIKE